ncbi:PcfJ domain-containing protein [Halobacteriovorax sp. HLS]|uniref:PcfJ domain-containing protein n=1 Tax=Halobacteriovorax sp. HLS TaxID=2234000 RepID=UPI000FDBA6B2|nr:PcfJ domain-containing protein [Halobacteriovorax sp. HLS]
MSISHVRETLLLNVFDLSLTEKEILAYIHAIGFKDESIVRAYSFSVKRKMPVLAKALFKEEAVTKKFYFMKESIPFFIENDNVLSLTVLYAPLIDKSYDEILEVIFGSGQFERYRKRVGAAFDKFGTNLLNNIYILSLLVDIHQFIDNVLVLNHRQAIDENIITKLKQPEVSLDWLVSNYKLTRVFRVLLTCEDENFTDSLRIINMIRNVEGDDYKEIVKECIGRKPISFYDIHTKLLPKSYEITNNQLRSISLNQDIENLDGENLYEYTISVPKTGEDLLITGATLKHCVGSFIEPVVNKTCQIINLKYKNKLAYTVELLPSSLGYRIGQFKGNRNSSEYEGYEGERYRNVLIELLNKKVEIK